MRANNLQAKIITGRFALPVTILISILCWIGIYIFFPDLPQEESTYAFWKNVIALPIPVWVNKLICLFLYFVIGYMLIQMNNSFGFIQTKASAQTTIYLLLVTACPAIHSLYPGDIASLTFTIALYMLFSAYQETHPEGYLFHAFVFIGLGSLIFPQLTLFIPIMFIGAFNFQALTIRSFLAAIIGWSLPYLLLLGHAFYYDNMDMFYQPFIELTTFYPIDFKYLQPWEIATLAYTFILYVVSVIHSLVQGHKDKNRTRVLLRFLSILVFFIFAFIALQPFHGASLLPFLLAGVSVLVSHLFVLTNNKVSNIFFICAIIGLVCLFAFNLWTLL